MILSLTRKRKQERRKEGGRDNKFNYEYLACGIQVFYIQYKTGNMDLESERY